MRFREMFSGWKDVSEYGARTVIFSERDPADLMYFIISGEVELTLRGEPLGTESDCGIIGEMTMINSATYCVTATTLTKVTMVRLDRDQVRIFIDENTEFALHIMAVMANRLRGVDEYITTQFAQLEYSVNRWTGHLDLLDILKDSEDLVEFPAEAVIFTEGMEGNCMYVVMEGEVFISLYEKVLATALPGEIVGEMALINSDIRSATVTAKTDCRLAIIDQSSFDSLIRHVPEFARHVMHVLANRLQIAFEMIESKPIEWLWPGRFPLGKLCLIGGLPSMGKNQIALWIAANITTGGKWPDSDEHAVIGDVLILSTEDDVADTIKPRLEAAGADVSRVHILKAVLEVRDDEDR